MNLPNTCQQCGKPNSVRSGRKYCCRACVGAAKTAGLVTGRPRKSPPGPMRQAGLCGCMTDFPIRHGLCNTHWQQWKRLHPDELPSNAPPPAPYRRPVLAKTCIGCGNLLPGSAFRNGHTCRECANRAAREKDISGPQRRGGSHRLWVRRTLVAATCIKCGGLRPGEEFAASERQGLTCNDCRDSLSAARNREKQLNSLDRATRRGQEWTGPELELLLRDDLTNAQLAEMLGRTYATVSVMKSKVRHDPRYAKAAGRGGE